MNLRNILKGKLSPNEIREVITSFDIIGDIGIIEIPDSLNSKEKLISGALRIVHKNLRVIVRKMGEREGSYRLRKMKVIRGEKDTETVHKEHKCRLKLDVETCYFSPRESTERQRVAVQVKPREVVLVMFAGIGPYAVAIGNHQPLVGKIVAIEINPDAYKYLLDNIRLNKLQLKITPMMGDVKVICPKLNELFDRVIMPLPKGAFEYLDCAVSCLKKGGTIHFYYWEHENELFRKSVSLVRQAAKKAGRRMRLVNARKTLPYGPRTWKVCIEAKIY